jgi:hypothetical protein
MSAAAPSKEECFCCRVKLGPKQLRQHLLIYQAQRSNLSPEPSDVEMAPNVGVEKPDNEPHAGPEVHEGTYRRRLLG